MASPPRQILELLESNDETKRLTAIRILTKWGHHELVSSKLGKLLQSPGPAIEACFIAMDTSYRERAIEILCQKLATFSSEFGRHEISRIGDLGSVSSVASAVLGMLTKKNREIDAAVEWLVAQTPESLTPRTPALSQFFAKVLKPQPRDSVKKRVCREVVYHWVWKACSGG
jgi:hypothetical protein